MFFGHQNSPAIDNDGRAARSTHTDGTGTAPRRDSRTTLLALSDWDNGTVVEETTVTPGPAAPLAPIGATPAMLVVVCLDACHALHLSTNDDPPRSQPVAEGSIIILDAQDEHRLDADSDLRIVCFGVETGVLDQLGRRTTNLDVPRSAAIDDRHQAPADTAVHGLATSAMSVLRDPSPSSRLFLEQLTCRRRGPPPAAPRRGAGPPDRRRRPRAVAAGQGEADGQRQPRPGVTGARARGDLRTVAQPLLPRVPMLDGHQPPRLGDEAAGRPREGPDADLGGTARRDRLGMRVRRPEPLHPGLHPRGGRQPRLLATQPQPGRTQAVGLDAPPAVIADFRGCLTQRDTAELRPPRRRRCVGEAPYGWRRHRRRLGER